MSENQQDWINWARALQHWGIKDGVASLLEISGSLNILVAQLIYLGQPLVSGLVSPGSLNAIAKILENPEDRSEFISFLREAPARGSSA